MRAHDAQAGDVAVRDAVGGLLLHLREHVADDARVVVGRLAGPRDVDGDEGELGPRERVVQVVLHEVVLGQVRDVGVLDVGDVGGGHEADVHFGGCVWCGVYIVGGGDVVEEVRLWWLRELWRKAGELDR